MGGSSISLLEKHALSSVNGCDRWFASLGRTIFVDEGTITSLDTFFSHLYIYVYIPKTRAEGTRHDSADYPSPVLYLSLIGNSDIYEYICIYTYEYACVCVYIYTHILSTDKQKATTAITGTLDERQKSFFDRWKKSWNSNILISNFQKFTCRFKK